MRLYLHGKDGDLKRIIGRIYKKDGEDRVIFNLLEDYSEVWDTTEFGYFNQVAVAHREERFKYTK